MSEEGQETAVVGEGDESARDSAYRDDQPRRWGQKMPSEPKRLQEAPRRDALRVFLSRLALTPASLTKTAFLTVVSVVAVIDLIFFRSAFGEFFMSRVVVVSVLAALLLYSAYKTILAPRTRDSNLGVKFVVAYDALFFILVGTVTVLICCHSWGVALLTSGSSLFVGGFAGLLFGYPQGVAQQAVAVPCGTNTTGTTPTPSTSGTQTQATVAAKEQVAHSKTLLADSAATLGKVITGFSLAKAGTVVPHFTNLCHAVGPALQTDHSATDAVFAGAMMLYFFLTGFFSGLLLPPYFMSDQF